MSKRPSEAIRLFFLQAHSPIHIGVGEGVGAINLPTAREATTQYPYIPGSSIKGVLREQAELTHAPQPLPDAKGTSDAARNISRYGDDPVVQAFGPPTERAGDARGGLVFSDARLLFLPLRSLVGGFALVTCPLILRRLQRELKLTHRSNAALDTLLKGACTTLVDQDAIVTQPTVLAYTHAEKVSVLLEDISLKHSVSPEFDSLATALKGLAWDEADHTFYAQRLAVVSDTLFGFFVQLHLEVRNRVKIDDATGTAATSGPWLEEYIPAEALLFGMVQGRNTALVMEAPRENTSSAEQDKYKDKDGQSSLDVLQGLVGPDTLLRFGGKSSGGAGRAFFRLASSPATQTEVS